MGNGQWKVKNGGEELSSGEAIFPTGERQEPQSPPQNNGKIKGCKSAMLSTPLPCPYVGWEAGNASGARWG
jgi:hypothetical protein